MSINIFLALYGMNSRMGRLSNIDKFDCSFFGCSKAIADEIDPELRILLETTFEAITDAGMEINYINYVNYSCKLFM